MSDQEVLEEIDNITERLSSMIESAATTLGISEEEILDRVVIEWRTRQE